MMKRIALLLLPLALLAGCSITDYQAADTPFDYGYTDTRLKDTIFRIHYKGRRSATGGLVSDFALLRAAELAIENNYPYFVVLDRDDEVINRTSHIRGRRETEITFDSYDAATGSGRGDAVTRVTGGSSSRYGEPRSLLLIQLAEEKSEDHLKLAYDAKYVLNAIQTKYQMTSAKK